MDLPDVMTAIEISTPGGPEVLVPVTRPVPRPGAGELLVRVAAAGVNRPDVLQRRGFYPPPPGASDVPGLEIAGEVVAAGEGATHHIGSKVTALIAGGGYAEYAVAPAATALPVPDGLSMAEAAALPETLFTVWVNLFERGFAADGDWVLVHGGTSGIGTMAISLCRLLGVKAIVTCGSDEKCAAAMGLGAAAAINYKTQDFVEEVKRVTGGAGVDVILDMVGGDYLPRNVACLAEDGRHVSIATQRGGVGRTQHRRRHAPPPDADRLDPSPAPGRLQGAGRRGTAAGGLAVRRKRPAPPGDGPHLSPRRSRRGPCADGSGGACRQDRAGDRPLTSKAMPDVVAKLLRAVTWRGEPVGNPDCL